MAEQKNRIVIEGVEYEVRPRTGRRPKGEPPPAGPKSTELGEQVEAVHRVAPKFSAFITVGVFLGLIVSGLLMYNGDPTTAHPGLVFTWIAICVVPFFVLVSGGIALFLDHRSRKRMNRT